MHYLVYVSVDGEIFLFESRPVEDLLIKMIDYITVGYLSRKKIILSESAEVEIRRVFTFSIEDVGEWRIVKSLRLL